MGDALDCVSDRQAAAETVDAELVDDEPVDDSTFADDDDQPDDGPMTLQIVRQA